MDETADEKSSADCVGAACQYSGTVGRTALCRVAVTLTYAAPGGHALTGRALYLPGGSGRSCRSPVTPPASPATGVRSSTVIVT